MAFGVLLSYQPRPTPPTFSNVTWKQKQDGKSRTVNTPKWQDLFKDLSIRKLNTESMHIKLHGTDLAHLPFAGKIKWMIAALVAVVCDMGSRPDSPALQSQARGPHHQAFERTSIIQHTSLWSPTSKRDTGSVSISPGKL